MSFRTFALGVALLLYASSGVTAGAAVVRPGIYKLHAISSDWCVGYRLGGGARLPYLATGDCTRIYERGPDNPILGVLLGIPVATTGHEELGYTPFAVVPHPGGGYTIRSLPPYNARLEGTPNMSNRLLSCVTVARNVVVGPPGIDVWPCDLPNGAAWSQAGGADQTFAIDAAGGEGNYRIWHMGERDDARIRKCIDVRGAGQNINTDLIDWDCNGQTNQIFHFEYMGPLQTRDDIATAQAAGAGTTLIGHAFVPAVAGGEIRHGIDIPGMDLGPPTDTADDGGTACQQMCRANAACRAFAWVRPGVQGPGAKCWLKSGVPASSPNPDVNSGFVSR